MLLYVTAIIISQNEENQTSKLGNMFAGHIIPPSTLTGGDEILIFLNQLKWYKSSNFRSISGSEDWRECRKKAATGRV